MPFKKIVIAEDDDAIAHLINMALGDAGYLCLRARNGEEALRLVKSQDPDLLVLDVMMPRLDGLEVARRLKSDVMWSRTPILMLTALAAVGQRVEGLEAGADDYMTKPFDLREFAARVKALVRSSRRERDRSPTTDLPGSRSIEEHLEGALKASSPVCVVHIDVLGFDGFADIVGFGSAEAVVKALGTLILETARSTTGGGAFVGHVGGSDFIALLAADQVEDFAQKLVASFEAQRGEILSGDSGAGLALVVAIATTDGAGPKGNDEMARRLGKAMQQAKAAGKSGHVVWAP